MIHSTDISGLTRLSRAPGATGPFRPVPASTWTDQSKYGFLDSVYAPQNQYIVSSELGSAYAGSADYASLSSRQSRITSDAEAIAGNLGLTVADPSVGGGLGESLGSAAGVQYGFGPGPEVVPGPYGMTSAAVYPDPTKILRSMETWHITAPSHYIYYCRNMIPYFTYVPQGHVYKAGEQSSEGLGSYMVVGNTVTIHGYLAFGASMLSSTVYYKWFLDPKLVSRVQIKYASVDPPNTCAENSSRCMNVNDSYRITSSMNPVDNEKLTVTRTRRIQDGAANNDDRLVIFANFTAVGTLQ